jgi:leucyl aminopeptidase
MIKVQVKNLGDMKFACDALILPLAEKQSPPRELDKALKGLIGRSLKSGEFSGKEGKVLVLHTGGMIKPQRVVLAGLGKKPDAEAMRKAGGASATALMGLRTAALSIFAISKHRVSPADFLEGAILGSYQYTAYRKAEKKPIVSLTILSKQSKALNGEIKYARSVALSTNFARDLVNTPAREMRPSDLVRAAKLIKGISVKTLGAREANKLGMNAYLSVSGGSKEPPKFIIASYKGKGSAKRPTVLVGKSITFDSGGLSLKPSGSMETMKYDMAGGAAVLGALRAASELKLKANLVGVLPACENLPGGDDPNKPGDVVRAIDGTTIEVLNTDAEGRLALADAIGYAVKKLKPARIIDLATLTGACTIALGDEAIALMGNNEKLVKDIRAAGDATYERAWHMPLFEEYADYIKSNIADIKNIGRGRSGGLVTAGYFLKGFAGKTPWVHLDIASTAWAETPGAYKPKGATGIGVRLLVRLITSLK